MWLRVAPPFAVCLLAWGQAFDGDTCALNDIPQEYIPEEVESVQLAGCRGLQDSLENVYELRWMITQAPAVDRRKLKTLEWYKLHRKIQGAPAQFGLDSYRSSLAPYLVEGVEGSLASADAAALRRLAGDRASCSRTDVACQEVNGEFRVTALRLRRQPSPDMWGQLSRLTSLRALSIETEITPGVEELDLPLLEVLELYTLARTRCPYAERLFGEVVGRHRRLLTLVIVPGKYREFEFDLKSYCGLTRLHEFHLPDMNIRSIPHCFSSMQHLRNAYLACNYLTEPPAALANLSELRSFIAFRQGEWTPCHFQGASRTAAISGVERQDCKPIWESKCGLDDDDNPRILCPSLGLHGSVQGFMDLSWPRLQKFWVDGGFLSGSIPEALPDAWPDIISLDLYQNDLSGPIPATLARVPFNKLQLQGNRLSGEVPPGIFQQPICQLNLADNKDLWGCAPSASMPPYKRRFAGTGISPEACGTAPVRDGKRSDL